MSEKVFTLGEIEPILDEVLDSGSEISLMASGVSMEPYIRDKTDKITIVKATGELKKGDVPLYKRDNGKFVLHRVVGIGDEGYIMRGDNQWVTEYPVKKSCIKAVLKSVERNGKVIAADGVYSRLYRLFLPAIRFRRKMMNFIKYRYNKHIKSRRKDIK